MLAVAVMSVPVADSYVDIVVGEERARPSSAVPLMSKAAGFGALRLSAAGAAFFLLSSRRQARGTQRPIAVAAE